MLEGAAEVQETTALMPDYEAPVDNEQASTAVAGVVGAVMTCVLAGGVGWLIVKTRRKAKTNEAG